MIRKLSAALLTAALMFGTGALDAVAAATPPSDDACAHPHPCGYEWQGPAGPFEVSPAERVHVEGSDGVLLNGWLWRPKVPADVSVPVILVSTPYTPRGAVASNGVGGLPGAEFVEKGYAVAVFSVRGTGDSGGCFGFKSLIEQEDQARTVEWLGDRPWSNGRVAMIGISYPGTTPVMAAIQNPPALKTIVIGGTVLDEYNFLHSPQGALFQEGAGVGPAFTSQYGLAPGANAGSLAPERIATTPERVCADTVDVNTVVPRGEVTGQRDVKYWTDRRFIDHVPGITAATFIVHGFRDRYGSGHAFQDDWAWQSLPSTPKRMLVGQWHHTWPNRNTIRPEWSLTDWGDQLVGWFDYWLKGIGSEAPGLGTVDFQDSSGRWLRTDAWPPPQAKNAGRGHSDERGPDGGVIRRRDEVLYLSQDKLQPKPGAESASFLSVPPPYRGGPGPLPKPFIGKATDEWRWTTPCSDPTRLAYLSQPVRQRTVLAGNAFAWFDVESSAPGGLIDVQLWDVPQDFNCNDPAAMDGLRPLSEGAADLSFHASEDYQAKPFPVANSEHIRIDIANLAEVLEPGHRLAVTLSHGVYYRSATFREYFPLLTIHGAEDSVGSSHLVLPVITGGFGGAPPTLAYPSRPFLPDCCTDVP